MKGQYQIFEQVIIFGIGLIILTSVFAIFNLLGEQVNVIAIHDNFKDVGLVAASNIIELYGQGKYFYNATAKLYVPKVIGNRLYELSIDKNGVHVNATDSGIYRSIIGLYNLNGTVLKLRGVELSMQSPLKLIFYNYTKEVVLQR
ncbi:MAG: hypothetical protein V1836_01375 [Candidatus Aenigmatarchaeota archaeon]